MYLDGNFPDKMTAAIRTFVTGSKEVGCGIKEAAFSEESCQGGDEQWKSKSGCG